MILKLHCIWLSRNSIPGPDHLSTLSTTIELLQLLLPEDTAGIIQEQEDDAMEGEPLKLTTEISISAAQMRSFLKFDSAAEDGPLRTLEKRLEVYWIVLCFGFRALVVTFKKELLDRIDWNLVVSLNS